MIAILSYFGDTCLLSLSMCCKCIIEVLYRTRGRCDLHLDETSAGALSRSTIDALWVKYRHGNQVKKLARVAYSIVDWPSRSFTIANVSQSNRHSSRLPVHNSTITRPAVRLDSPNPICILPFWPFPPSAEAVQPAVASPAMPS